MLNIFLSCKGLTTITIGNGIKEILRSAFAWCTELTDVTCYAESVPYTSSNVFDSSYIEYATLYVPSSAVDAYKETDPWKNFMNIMGINPTRIESINNIQHEPVSYFSLDGRQINSPKSGTVVVKKQGNRMKKVLIK